MAAAPPHDVAGQPTNHLAHFLSLSLSLSLASLLVTLLGPLGNCKNKGKTTLGRVDSAIKLPTERANDGR